MRFVLSPGARCARTTNLCPQGPRRRLMCKSSTETQTGLVQALGEQFRTETLPWIKELVDPWTSGPLDLPAKRPPKELATPDSKFAEVNGISVHYHEIGMPRPECPSLVLWHGFNGSVFNWRYVMKELEKSGKYHVIAFDRPPFGLTERPPADASEVSPYSTDGAIALARGLLLQKGISRAVHAGHSAGANAALKMAIQHEAEVEGIIFVSPAISTQARVTKSDAGSVLKLLYTRALFGNRTAGLRYIQKRILTRSEEVRAGASVGRFDASKVTTEDVDFYLLPTRADKWGEGALENFKMFNIQSEPPNILAVKLPVLVLQGKQDGATTLPFVQKLITVLEARPSGKTEALIIDECGHLPMEEHPLVIAAAIAQYLDQRASDRASL